MSGMVGIGRAGGLAAATCALLVCMVASLAIGAVRIPPGDVFAALTSSNGSDAHLVVTELRVPRTALGVLVGAALGVAGALMQGVTRNPLAEPGILGVNAGAAFAVVVAIETLKVDTVAGYVVFALGGAAIAAVVVHVLGATGGRATPVKIALAGAVLTSLLLALTSAILVLDATTLDEFRFWIVGSIAGRDAGVLWSVLPFLAAGLLLAIPAGRWLNALALGDDVARSLGQRVSRIQAIAAVAFVLCSGGAVAAAGPIAFVGLTVPHIARVLVGPDYRWIVPFSAVLGALLLLAADIFGRVIAAPAEVEVGIVTAAIGAPFFIWLVRRRRLAAL
jgi:iron complex transport system permease protein